MGHRSFVNKSTTTDGKVSTEAYADSVIVKALNAFRRVFKRPDFCAILVGCPEGLIRHLARMSQLGYATSRVVIFEHDWKTFQALDRLVKRRRLKCQVVFGDLLQGVEILHDAGFHFSYIEFDGISHFGRYEFDLYQLARRIGVTALVCQGSSRGQLPEVKAFAKSQGLKTYLNHGFKCYELEDVARRLISRKLRGYVSEFFTYRGVSNMYMQVSVSK
jgi:hypothetical protein